MRISSLSLILIFLAQFVFAQRADKKTQAREHLDSGKALFEQKEYKDAIKEFDDAIELDRRLGEAYLFRGKANREIGKAKDAIEDFDLVTRTDRDNPQGFYERGLTYYQEEEYNEAKNDFEQALKIDPDMSEPYYYLGMISYKNEKYDKAVDYFTKTITNDIDNKEAYKLRAKSYFHLKIYEGASKDIDKLEEMSPEVDPELYYMRGMIAFDNKNSEEAISNFSKAIEKLQDEEMKKDAYFNRAKLYMDQQKYKETIADLDQVLDIDKKLAEAYVIRGKAKLALDDKKEACKDFEKGKKYGSTDAEYLIFDNCEKL